jgi:hypothetical protein
VLTSPDKVDNMSPEKVEKNPPVIENGETPELNDERYNLIMSVINSQILRKTNSGGGDDEDEVNHGSI